jgi:hypothetical protein
MPLLLDPQLLEAVMSGTILSGRLCGDDSPVLSDSGPLERRRGARRRKGPGGTNPHSSRIWTHRFSFRTSLTAAFVTTQMGWLRATGIQPVLQLPHSAVTDVIQRRALLKVGNKSEIEWMQLNRENYRLFPCCALTKVMRSGLSGRPDDQVFQCTNACS